MQVKQTRRPKDSELVSVSCLRETHTALRAMSKKLGITMGALASSILADYIAREDAGVTAEKTIPPLSGKEILALREIISGYFGAPKPSETPTQPLKVDESFIRSLYSESE